MEKGEGFTGGANVSHAGLIVGGCEKKRGLRFNRNLFFSCERFGQSKLINGVVQTVESASRHQDDDGTIDLH